MTVVIHKLKDCLLDMAVEWDIYTPLFLYCKLTRNSRSLRFSCRDYGWERGLMYNAYIIHQNEWGPAVCQRRQSQTQAVPLGACFIPPLITLYWSNTDGGGNEEWSERKKKKDMEGQGERSVVCSFQEGEKETITIAAVSSKYTVQSMLILWPTTFAKMLTTWNSVFQHAMLNLNFHFQCDW